MPHLQSTAKSQSIRAMASRALTMKVKLGWEESWQLWIEKHSPSKQTRRVWSEPIHEIHESDDDVCDDRMLDESPSTYVWQTP